MDVFIRQPRDQVQVLMDIPILLNPFNDVFYSSKIHRPADCPYGLRIG